MYLTQVVIENSGPLKRFDLALAFTPEQLPKPLVLVGANGGGKTNLLSLITDALFEAAASHYSNVLPAQSQGRAWFRMVGGRTTTVGAAGEFSLLMFAHQGKKLLYQEKGGNVDVSEAKQKVDANLAPLLRWSSQGSEKNFAIDDELSRAIFQDGVYVSFPSSRSEIPFWLNRESLPETEFDTSLSFAKRLRKPLYVEKSLNDFKQWVLSVLLESRTALSQVAVEPVQFQAQTNPDSILASHSLLATCNKVLQCVLDDSEAQFIWLGRKSGDKVGVVRGNQLMLPNLDALSGGQSILLGLFGTLLRYADQSQSGPTFNLQEIEGMCVVDEIDSHIHIDLQYKILPRLMHLFPKIQFILSSHSPFFVLGMKSAFGDEGFQLVEMPEGRFVTSETYTEFGKAMEVLTVTEAFSKAILFESSKTGVPNVFVEGETDEPYLRRAAELLGRSPLLGRCEIKWVGAKDKGGQGFHTGKDALDHTLKLLRANPKLTTRKTLLLYDNDAKKQDADYESVSVRSMPTNPLNSKIKAGVENLLPEEIIFDQDYQITEQIKDNGDVVTRKTLRKAELCTRICLTDTAEHFSGFEAALDTIESYLDSQDLISAS